MLDCCVQCEEYEKMKEIYKNLKISIREHKEKLKIDIITHSTLIKGYSKMKKFEKVVKIYEKLKKSGEFVLDEVFYNTLLDACAKNNQFEKSNDIIDEMKENKIKFSNVTYSILMKINSKSKKFI